MQKNKINLRQKIKLSKFQNELVGGEAHYYLDKAKTIHLNEYLGRHVLIEFLNEIHCVACDRKIKKSFQQGFCFPCFRALAQCDSCMMRPELCHYHEGTCREPEWGEAHCFQSHYIYLANTGNLKVGITRFSNVPHRWIDQGATQALPILRVKERLHSGLVEVLFKSHVADKTNWRTMLKGGFDAIDLIARRDDLFSKVKDELDELMSRIGVDAIEVLQDQKIIDIHFPVLQNPLKITTHNLDKNPLVEGELLGIRGQYLILDTGVFNVRKFSGYCCEISLT
jgi:hypothetical protein